MGDELGNRSGRDQRIDGQDLRHAGKTCNRRDIADEIETELFIECCVESSRHVEPEERIAVRRRAHDRFGGEIGSGTWAVLDNKLLAEPLREPLTYQAGEDVSRACGRKSDHDAHRPRRIGLRPCEARYYGERSSTRGEMQKLSAGTFHGALLNTNDERLIPL